MRKTKKIMALILTGMMVLSMAACGKSGETKVNNSTQASTASASVKSDSSQKELTFGDAGGYFGATNLNPADTYNGWYMTFYGVGETLFKLDSNYNAKPWLVEKYETNDDCTWTFNLRNDVYFQNGEKMTAESVKKSFDYMMASNVRGSETFNIKEIKADGQVLTIITKTPTPALTRDLCDPLGVVQYIADGIDYEEAAIMTGPYIVDKFTAKEKCVLKSFDKYWGGAAKVGKVTLLSMADQDAVAMSLQSGEIDMAVMPDSASLQLFSDTDTYTYSSATSTRGCAVCFNMASDVTKDIAVRKAVAMAIDRDGFCSSTHGIYTPCYGLYSKIVGFGGTDGLKLDVNKTDLDGAKKLLEDSGYKDTNSDGILDKNGKPLEVGILVNSSSNDFVNFCQMLQSDLAEIGVKLNINESTAVSDLQKSGDFDMVIESYGMAPTGNYQYFTNIKFVTGASANYGKYSNAKVDELSKQLESTFDENQRNDIAKQITQNVLDDMYYCVFANKSFYCVYNNKIVDFEPQPSEYYLLDNVMDIAE